MLASYLIPAAFRQPRTQPAPGWFNRHVSPVLQSVAGVACSHPIHVFVALLASTTYLTLLNENPGRYLARRSLVGKPDFGFLLGASQTVAASAEGDWQWAVSGQSDPANAVLTLVFPHTDRHALPAISALESNFSAGVIAVSTQSPLAPGGFAVAVAVAAADTTNYIESVRQLLPQTPETAAISDKWVMENVRAGLTLSWNIRHSIESAWYSFVRVLSQAQTIDILVMALGYIAMYATFVSLFLSMRQLGSRFWLAGSVLLSSFSAFLFAIIVATKQGVPLNLVLLSEGLPFLVVVIGFEKPIVLTKAVFAAFDRSKRSDHSAGAGSPQSRTGKPSSTSSPIQTAIMTAVRECGFQIICDYLIEIGLLMALLLVDSVSGVQGGLRQFCILAAWVLVCDCFLLFSFYTAILSVKLEINRIKYYVDICRTLEDDGVSHRIAESVAAQQDRSSGASSDGQNDGSGSGSNSQSFGKRLRDLTVPKFKALMVGGFLLVNIFNFIVPFVSESSSGALASAFHRSDNLTLAAVNGHFDPIEIAGPGLQTLAMQMKNGQKGVEELLVLVLPPIMYRLVPISSGLGTTDMDDLTQPLPVVGSILKSLEDPVLSKWIVVALALSLAFNGYLFNAARWSFRDIPEPAKMPQDSEVLACPAVEGEVPGFGKVGLLRTGTSTPIEKVPSTRNLLHSHFTSPLSERSVNIMEPVVQPPLASCRRPRLPLNVAAGLLKEGRGSDVADEDLVELALIGKLPGYALEKTVKDKVRAVKIRRSVVSRTVATKDIYGGKLLEHSLLPYDHYDYDRVHGACCENVIGYMPLPVGVAGPLRIDDQNYFLPMATTEGVLVASTSRGCKALNHGGGVATILTDEGMTRGPCVSFPSMTKAGRAKLWVDSDEGQRTMSSAFNSTSRFARLRALKTAIAGRYLYIRFKTTTGDAMGMNMISKGVEHALAVMSDQEGFEEMEIVSVSGNYCTDKKAAAINWIEGRGKSVVAEGVIPGDIVESVLKSTVDAMVQLNISKNLIGSAMAGALGGFNAHAANIVAAMYLATGQDPAQVVESSSCITVMERSGHDLRVSVSMPCIEVGTIGGGTILEPQGAMLDLLGVKGPHPTQPGANARRLASIIASGVLAGEVSLCAALAAGHLVQAHMAHNRSTVPSVAPTRPATPGPLSGPEGVRP